MLHNDGALVVTRLDYVGTILAILRSVKTRALSLCSISLVVVSKHLVSTASNAIRNSRRSRSRKAAGAASGVEQRAVTQTQIEAQSVDAPVDAVSRGSTVLTQADDSPVPTAAANDVTLEPSTTSAGGSKKTPKRSRNTSAPPAPAVQSLPATSAGGVQRPRGAERPTIAAHLALTKEKAARY
jgi:hypothetical protein